MTANIHIVQSLVLLVASAGPTVAQNEREHERLPEGHSGIASQHAGDVGIDRHRNVVLVENVDDDLESVTTRWDAVKAKQNLSLATDVPSNSDGKYSLLVTHVGSRVVRYPNRTSLLD